MLAAICFLVDDAAGMLGIKMLFVTRSFFLSFFFIEEQLGLYTCL